MKPTDLKIPFIKGEWQVALMDRVWYVPLRDDRLQSFVFPGWDDPAFFGNDNPVHIEYCSGNGGWVTEKARLNPHVNWVAVEKKFSRMRKIWSKIKNHQLDNLIVLCGEALDSTERFFPADSVREIFINFPDPWPKRKHANYRLVQESFLKQVKRILQEEGSITLVTDDADYSQQMIETFAAEASFASSYPDQGYATDWKEYGTSYFESLWLEKGREIRYHQFTKRASVPCVL